MCCANVIILCEFTCNFISLKIVIVNIDIQSPSSFILYLFDSVLCKNAIISLRLTWNCFFFLHAVESPLTLVKLAMRDVHIALSSPALLSSWRLTPPASFVKSTHLLLGLPHFLLPSVFPPIIVFSQITVSFPDVPEAGQLQCCHRCLQQCFIQASFGLGPTWSSFQDSKLSKELSSNIIFQKTIYFASALFTVQLLHSYIVIGNTRV